MKNREIQGQFKNRISKQAEDFLLSDSASAITVKTLLMVIGIAGISVVGASLPGLVKAIGSFSRVGKRIQEKHQGERIKKTLAYLKHKKLVEIVERKNGKMMVKLTNKGEKRLVEYSLDDLEIKKPKKWDRKWRVLMFDIPSHSKSYDYARDALRNKIKSMGFCQIQKSVWVHPYECEDELLFIAEMFQVQDCIEILTVDKVLHEELLRKNFPFLQVLD